MKRRANIGELKKDISTIAKGTGITFSGEMIGSMFGYVYSLILARAIGPELIGIYFLAMSTISLIIPFAKFGLETGVLRYASLYLGTGDHQRVKGTLVSSLGIGAVLGVLLGIVLFLYSGDIAAHFSKGPELSFAIRVLSLTIPLFVVTSTSLSFTRAFREMKYRVYVSNLLVPISKIGIATGLFLLGWKLFSVLAAEVVSLSLGTILSLYYVARIFPQRTHVSADFEIKELLRFSAPILLSGVLMRITGDIDGLMLGFFRTPEQVGIYKVALRTALLGGVILASVNSIFAPITSDLHHREEFGRLESLFKMATRWTFTLTFPFLLTMIVFSRSIMALFGAGFIPGAPVLIILCISQVINNIVGPAGLLILMSGRSHIILLNNACLCVMNVLLNLLLIPRYGAFGAAYATGTSIVVINIIRLIEAYYFLRMHPFEFGLLKPLFSGGIAFLISLLISDRVDLHNVVVLFFSIVCFLIIYVVVLLLLRLNHEDAILLNAAKKKLAVIRQW